MKRILAAVDFSTNTEAVIHQAAALAGEPGSKLWILHTTPALKQTPAVYEYTQFSSFEHEMTSAPANEVELARDLCAEEFKQEHQALLNLSATMQKDGIDSQAMLLKGDAAELILEKAENLDIDIIVMGSHGHGLLHKILVGSVTEKVLRNALYSVLVVPPPKDEA